MAADHAWGHCQHCKYFASLARIPLPTEQARCMHPQLSKYELKVFGGSGCRGFELRTGLEPEVEEPPQHVRA